MARSRFQTFVALRYLMAHPRHFSRLALVPALIGLGLGFAIVMFASHGLEAPNPRSLVETGSPYRRLVMQIGGGCMGVGALLFYVFCIRWFFTFYSTVSVVGVSIGCSALVIVLSVVNGFESDLRQKILGSNAHIQISKDDGEFTEWEDLRARIDRVPGVVASTPFATSEVVVAANSNYYNVIIKGIDVASAVKVTKLEKNLEKEDGLRNLEPLIADESEPAPVQAGSPPPGPDAIDPAPADLPTGGDPIDYSDPDADALDAPPAPVLDPAPTDFAEGAELDDEVAPRDFSTGPIDVQIRDLKPGDLPTKRPVVGSPRIATLSGVLVGRELVKQIHLYVGQEVRLVSPLVDPMNPDANGSPIPFNRDYRVAGIFYTGMYEYDLKLVYVTLDSLQRFLRLGDAIDGIEVRLEHADDVDVMVGRLQKELGPTYRVQGWRELNRNLFSALKLEKIAMFLILAIIIIVASFSIVGTLIMTVVEKARQIALLKTLGASDLGIVLVFVIQGSLIGLIGGTLGLIIGLSGCAYLIRVGYGIPAEVYYIEQLPVQIDGATVALVFVSALVISFAATIYPSILGAQLRPAVGLKRS